MPEHPSRWLSARKSRHKDIATKLPRGRALRERVRGRKDEGKMKKVNARARVPARARSRARARVHTCVQKVPSVRFCQSWRVASIAGVGDATVLQYIETGRQQTNHAPATNLPGSNSCRSAAYAKPPGLYSQSIYVCSLEFPIEDSIPLGLTLGYSISRGLLLVLLFGSRRSSSPSCDLPALDLPATFSPIYPLLGQNIS